MLCCKNSTFLSTKVDIGSGVS
jgi:5'-AMP-activated protein kinase, catalytic alpha subunit